MQGKKSQRLFPQLHASRGKQGIAAGIVFCRSDRAEGDRAFRRGCFQQGNAAAGKIPQGFVHPDQPRLLRHQHRQGIAPVLQDPVGALHKPAAQPLSPVCLRSGHGINIRGFFATAGHIQPVQGSGDVSLLSDAQAVLRGKAHPEEAVQIFLRVAESLLPEPAKLAGHFLCGMFREHTAPPSNKPSAFPPCGRAGS